jgi:hypothetical protein
MRIIPTSILLLFSFSLFGQQSVLPENISYSKKYVFYLHGAIVQEMGIDAVSADFGRYEYMNILEALTKRGFHVISEVRPKGSDVVRYAEKVSSQIDTLLKKGARPQNIVVVGASQGAYIAIETSHIIKQAEVKFAILALCNDYNVNFYSKYKNELCGDFLSIFEESDQKKSCDSLLNIPTCKTGYHEIQLTMGNGHGFIFKPYKDWVDPLAAWINK